MKVSDTWSYALGGFLFGLMFPFFSWILDAFVFHSYPVELETISLIHLENPLHFVIDTAPVVLGIAFSVMGSYSARLKKSFSMDAQVYNSDSLAIIRRMRIANIFLPLLVIVALVVSFLLIQFITSNQQNDSKLINYAGRQRMLSQQIAKSAAYLTYSTNSARVHNLNTINKAALDFEETHQSLTKKENHIGLDESYEPSKEIMVLLDSLSPYYYGILAGVEEVTEATDLIVEKERLRSSKNALSKIERNARRFLPIMNEVVFLYQKESEEKSNTLYYALVVTLGGIMVLVILLSVLGFKPIVDRTQESFARIQTAQLAIEDKNKELVRSEEEIKKNAEKVKTINQNLEKSQVELKNYINRVSEAKKLAKLAAYDLDVKTDEIIHTEHLNSLLGLDKDVKITDNLIKEYIHPEDKNYVISERQKSVASRKDTFYKFRTKVKNSSKWHWMSGATHVILTEEGKLDYVVNVMQDITETVENEEKLQEILKEVAEKNQELAASEEELRQNSEALQRMNDELFVAQREAEEKQKLLNRAEKIAQMGSFEMNMESVKYTYSENLAEIYGLDKDDLTDPRRHLKYFHPDDQANVEKQSLELSMGKRDDMSLVGRIKGKKHHEWRYLKLAGSTIKNTNGMVVKVLGMVQDVTEEVRQKEVMQELLEYSRMNQDALEESQRISRVVSYDMDVYSKEVRWSNTFAEVFDIAPSEVPDDTEEFQKWIFSEDVEQANESWARAIANKAGFNEIYRVKTPNGKELYIREQGYPVFDNEGRLISMKGTLQDITQSELIKKEIEVKSEYIAKQNSNFVSSVNYAQRIQSAMLGDSRAIKEVFSDAFVLFEPKDIVSGDFYWYGQIAERKVIIVGDCTGHGVPGAFMSLLGITTLNDVILQRQITTPSKILDELNKEIVRILKQDSTGNRDGMDMSVVVIDESVGMLEFAGAKNPLVCINKRRKKGGDETNLTLVKGDNISIGGRTKRTSTDKFTNHTINIDDVETFYLYSDGFQDQFGGEEGRKFLSKKFRKLLYDTHSTSMRHQRVALKRALMNWMGTDYEQTDDICVVGVAL